MQLLQRASFPSPAVNPLLIFCGCCSLVHLIYSVCLTSGESLLYGTVASWFIASQSIAGGTGSYPLLLTFLCIKFQDTNSIFVPRRNFKRLNRLFKEESIKNEPFSAQRKETKKRKKTERKGKIGDKHKPIRVKGDKDKLKKSQHNLLRHNSTSNSTIYSGDHAAGIKHQVILPIPTQHSSLFNLGHSDKPHISHVSTDTRGKRKSGRRGKNTNEFPASTPSPSSRLGGFSLLGNAFLDHKDEEALRRKILDKVDALDPLMCLPKVLCGYSSRRRRKNYTPSTTPTTTTSTTLGPKISEDVIDEYLHLLGIIPPIPKEQHEDNLKEAITYLKLKSQSSKEKKKSVKSKRTKYQKTKGSIQNDLAEQEQSGSASSSAESDESAEYKRYHARRPPASYFARHPFYRHPVYPGRPIRIPNRAKWMFNRNKDSEENDLDEDDSEIEPEDDEMELDDEDVKYIVERAKMHKLMNEAGSHSDENWWKPFDEEQKVDMPQYYYPPPAPSYDPLAADDILGSSDGGITGWFSNMFGNFMPRISWGGGATKKDPDDFKSDPFFTSFDGRGFMFREARNFPSETLKFSSLTSTSQPPRMVSRKMKQLGWDEDDYSSARVNSRQFDYNLGEDRADPAAKYRTAVEIASRVASPSQCDFIYNGCPLTYEEILAIINEPVRQKASRTKPSSTTTTSSTTTSTTTSPTTTAKGNKSFTHNFITPPPPQQIVVPLHQQQQFTYQPPQSIFLHQHPHHGQRPQYHNLHPPQHSYEQHYNHQRYQQQLAELPHIMYNPHLRRQPHPTLIPNIEDIMAQVAKNSGEKPHKTKIHQALPNGEVEINVHYRPSSESSEKRRKPNLPPGIVPFSDSLKYTQDITVEETLLNPYSVPSSLSSSYEHSLLSNPFHHKVLTYPNYEFSSQNGYKIRKKGEMEEKPAVNEDVKVVSNTIKLVGSSSSSGTSLSASEENNNNAEENVSPSVPEKSKRRTQRVPPNLVAQKTKGKGKSKRKQMFKDTSSSPPRRRHSSSSHHKIQPQQQQGSQEMIKKWKKKKGNGNHNNMKKKNGKEKRKRIRNDDDDNSSGNNNSAASTSSSNEKLSYNNKGRWKWRTKYFDQMQKKRRKMLKKKRRREPHLHKQSSESIEAKKRRKIAASNAIYPIYGHPFPPPYAGYYHTPVTSTPTSPSFFSYFFGR